MFSCRRDDFVWTTIGMNDGKLLLCNGRLRGGSRILERDIHTYIYMVKSKKWCPNGFFGNTIVQTPARMFLFFLLYPPTLGL